MNDAMNSKDCILMRLPATEALTRAGLAGAEIPLPRERISGLFDTRKQVCVDRLLLALLGFLEAHPETLPRLADTVVKLAWVAGGTLAEAGFAEAALDCYTAGLCAAPDHPGLRCRAAMTLQALGQHDRALAAYRSLLNERPEIQAPLLRLLAAHCAADAGRREEALEMIEPCRLAMMGEDAFWDLLAEWQGPEGERPAQSETSAPLPFAPPREEGSEETAESPPPRKTKETPMNLSEQIQSYARSIGTACKEKKGLVSFQKTVAERKAFLSKQKLNYIASFRVDDAARAVRFREMLAETKSGLSSGDPELSTGFGFKTETYRTGAGQAREGHIQEQSNLFGKKYQYDFDFSAVRPEIEALCKAAGYTLEFALKP